MQETDVHEGLVADVLPADTSFPIDQDCSVKRLAFEIIEATEGLEHVEIWVWSQRQIHLSVVAFEGFGKRVCVFRADADDFDSCLSELIGGRRKIAELFGAMEASESEVKDQDVWFSFERLRRAISARLCAWLRGDMPAWSNGRGPSDGS